MKKNALFNQIQISTPKRNLFDLSHDKKLSCSMGKIIPIMCEEIIPGDKWKKSTSVFLRLAPMTAPILERVNVIVHDFFVPLRLVWPESEKFFSGGENVTDPAIPFPYMDITDANKYRVMPGTLHDYLGGATLPTGGTITVNNRVSQLPYRAYQLIWNEYYRDQNLQAKIDFPTTSTPLTDDGTISRLLDIRAKAWEKDYFTSALPFTQKGNPVNIPGDVNYKPTSSVLDSTTGLPYTNGGTLNAGTGNGNFTVANTVDVRLDNVDSISMTINDLRRANKLQEWLEKNARGGSRYIETMLAHFGVKSSNKLLQRPQYLGGSKNGVQISEVLSSWGTEGGLPLGEMGGHGISAGSNFMFNHFFEEHGFVFSLMSIIPKTSYLQGQAKFLNKFDKFEYAWPSFGHLGEQEIKLPELWVDYATGNAEEIFGYQSRYAEYKFGRNTVHGDFKDTLDHWHMGRIFATKPQLNEQFIASDPTQRIFANTEEADHKCYVHIYHDIKAFRPLPLFGTPTL